MAARFRPVLVEDMWRIRCSSGWAHGSIWTHARGFELRILWDGEAVWSNVRDELDRAQQDARSAKTRLERDGRDALDSLEALLRKS
jgi:hypothetical protein